ncbi:uncharacterized protein V1518DRAFT_44581 [Limtongia smithiae]|uniref:uncharacterized protein n=1 Tax=Limtongia smithiae TaxID=1125753 RepID=UPI0034CFF932
MIPTSQLFSIDGNHLDTLHEVGNSAIASRQTSHEGGISGRDKQKEVAVLESKVIGQIKTQSCVIKKATSTSTIDTDSSFEDSNDADDKDRSKEHSMTKDGSIAVTGSTASKKKKKSSKPTKDVLAAVSSAEKANNTEIPADEAVKEGKAALPSDKEPQVPDPITFIRAVIQSLDPDGNGLSLSFFKNAFSCSVGSPHISFTQEELEEAENRISDRHIIADIKNGKVTVEQLEKEWLAMKKETELLEKKLTKVIKKNRKIVLEV